MFAIKADNGDCAALLQHVIDIIKELGITLVHEKTEVPAIVYHALELN